MAMGFFALVLHESAEAQEIMEIHDALRARKESRWGFGNNSNA
jgi:hypothetical protein